MSVLRFKLKRNVNFDLTGTGSNFAPPMRVIQKPLDQNVYGHYEGSTLVPVFDMDFVHELPLPDIEPHLPETKAYDKEFSAELRAEAYRDAIRRRSAAEAIRRRIAHFVKNGTVEIVSDDSGFLSAELVSEVEQRVAAKAGK